MNQNKIKCPNCKKSITADSVYCPRCSHKIPAGYTENCIPNIEYNQIRKEPEITHNNNAISSKLCSASILSEIPYENEKDKTENTLIVNESMNIIGTVESKNSSNIRHSILSSQELVKVKEDFEINENESDKIPENKEKIQNCEFTEDKNRTIISELSHPDTSKEECDQNLALLEKEQKKSSKKNNVLNLNEGNYYTPNLSTQQRREELDENHKAIIFRVFRSVFIVLLITVIAIYYFN